jgi:hypothetical protein
MAGIRFSQRQARLYLLADLKAGKYNHGRPVVVYFFAGLRVFEYVKLPAPGNFPAMQAGGTLLKAMHITNCLRLVTKTPLTLLLGAF